MRNPNVHTSILIRGTIGVGGNKFWEWGTPHIFKMLRCGLVRAGSGVGGSKLCQIIMPLCGSILQLETCKILIIAENPRWQKVDVKKQTFYFV